jgi:hypothetical protein
MGAETGSYNDGHDSFDLADIRNRAIRSQVEAVGQEQVPDLVDVLHDLHQPAANSRQTRCKLAGTPMHLSNKEE